MRHRYKEGFDRIAIVLFVLFACAFGLAWLVVSEPYGLPAEGTPEAAAIAAEVEAACNTELEEALVMLCRERILGSHRWAWYRDRLDADGLAWLYLGGLGLVMGGIAWPLARWVWTGFRAGRRNATISGDRA